jgi:hypothetical protein
MASILNATTSSGLVTSADNSGSLQLATNNGTTAVTITTAQNVGIGVASPDAKLDISGGGSTSSAIALTNNDNATISSVYSTVFQADRNNNIGGREFNWRFGGKGYTDGTSQMYLSQAGNLAFNSGYGSVAVAYGCRAWVNFNGQGTVAIRGSGNVSSITDNGTGNYTVNFANAMPDSNYTTNITLGGGNAYIGTTETRNTGSVLIYGWNDASGHFDSNSVGVAIFR